MGGEIDLARILARLEVVRRPGVFTFARAPGPVEWDEAIHALVREDGATTLVTTVDEARRRHWDFEFEAAWLTLQVHTSLEGVGLTAAVAHALAAEGIACNVLAGYHHDHLLVPVERVDDALVCLERLRTPEAGTRPDR